MTYQLDANHAEIVVAFKQLGAIVIDNARVKRHEAGQLDIWVGLPNPDPDLPGIWIYVEIKTTTGKPRPAQKQQIAECMQRGLPVEVVRTVDDVIAIGESYTRWMRQSAPDWAKK